jgi:hypothetical protein
LKSTYDQLEREHIQLKGEHIQLKGLVAYLRDRPEKDAFEIFRRLKDPNLFVTLQRFKEAETRLMIPLSSGSDMNSRQVAEIDEEALAASPIKVPSRPWTAVAGDGIVSSLISAFFKWDDAFVYSFIDRDLFVRDMRRGTPSERQYCSPLLVNAICAMRSVRHLTPLSAISNSLPHLTTRVVHLGQGQACQPGNERRYRRSLSVGSKETSRR